MPAKGRGVAIDRAPAQKGYAQTIYQTITSPDNRSLVTALTVFTAGVAFFHTGLGDMLLPPL